MSNVKDQSATRFFSVNCNGFGPRSSDKIDQIIRESRKEALTEC